MQKTTSKA